MRWTLRCLSNYAVALYTLKWPRLSFWLIGQSWGSIPYTLFPSYNMYAVILRLISILTFLKDECCCTWRRIECYNVMATGRPRRHRRLSLSCALAKRCFGEPRGWSLTVRDAYPDGNGMVRLHGSYSITGSQSIGQVLSWFSSA